MPELQSIPVVVEQDRPRSLESRLEDVALRLRALGEDDVRREFSLASDVELLKSTISLCDVCLNHVPAVVFIQEQRVLLNKRCESHGVQVAVLENDARYYRLSSKDRWGKPYTRETVVELPVFKSCCAPSSTAATLAESQTPTREVHSNAPRDASDQRKNKSCTVLVEITDACNLACRVCYADSKGDRILPFDRFKTHMRELVELKGSIDSVQLTGGEASLHPQYWDMIDWLYHCDGVRKIYLPTNGIALAKSDGAKRLRPYRSKVLVLLQFDGGEAATNKLLRRADPRRLRERLIRRLSRAGVCMQLTMTLTKGVSEREIAWIVRLGVKHKNIRLIGMLPAFYSGRYEIEQDPLDRMTLSDVIKGAAAGMRAKTSPEDFMPIPCSHPNCGWATLFARRFGLLFNIAKHVDLDVVMDDVAYKTILEKREMRALIGSRYRARWQRLLSRVGRRLIRPRDVFGIAIKPFMDRFNYDQDRVSACCHHMLDTQGTLVSFCEYNARIRKRDPWTKFPKLEGH